MAKAKKNSIGNETYGVLAEQVTLLYQEVEACTPQDAIRLAEEQNDWEPVGGDSDRETVTDKVWDVEANDFIELDTSSDGLSQRMPAKEESSARLRETDTVPWTAVTWSAAN